jgi:PDDEXK-like domain of unknown function (DUF3799)
VRAGIFTIPADAYHADPCEVPSLSASIAHLLVSKSPLHAWTAHPKLNPDYERVEEQRFAIGTVTHALMLEHRDVEETVEIVNADDWRTKAAKEAREAAREAGKIPLLAKQLEDVLAMMRACKRQLEAIELEPPIFAAAGRSEQTLIWEDAGGVICRALIDWLHDDYRAIDDLKTTTGSAAPTLWMRNNLYAMGADVQLAFHARGVKQLTGIEPQMRYIVQEASPPYALSVISLGSAALMAAQIKVEHAIARWSVCLDEGKWPGYAPFVHYADLPAWEEMRALELEEAV